MKLRLLFNQKNVYDETLLTIYHKNYSSDLEYTPDYRYDVVLNWCDFWFHLVNQDDEIIGCCSVTIDDKDEYYVINDVLIEEKFRGNNYAILLLLNAINHFNDSTLTFKICAHIDNLPAVKTYNKVFGDPVNSDETYFYFLSK